MGLVRYAIDHPVTVLMASLAATVFGLVALGRLPLNLLPDITYPTLTLETALPDASPEEVERLLTQPLEEAVGVVAGLRRVRSRSAPGRSQITLEFAWSTDMDYASLDVREKIDMMELPDDAGAPVLLRFDPGLDPILRLGVFLEEGAAQNLTALRDVAERHLKKELESLEGVAAVRVHGGLEEEIQVDVEGRRLAAMGLTIAQVGGALQRQNVNASGGRLRDRDSEYLVRSLNEFESLEDIEQTVVSVADGRLVRVADVATVTRGHRERQVMTLVGPVEAVEVAVFKEGDANTVTVARRVKRHLERIAADQLPPGVATQVWFNQSNYIAASVREVQSNALLGGLLAVLVLWLFLRHWRSTATIALSIPLSIVATFVLMRRFGVTLNIMSLGGLALGVGMLVDNSIVVLEAIGRRREAGATPAEAAYQGASAVGQAVIASTFTTIAVFLPIVFVEGIAGQLFRDLSLTVTASLLVSLVVALTVIPAVAGYQRRAGLGEARERRLAAGESVEDPDAGGSRTPAAGNARGGRWALGYERGLRGLLRRPGRVVLALAVVLIGTGWIGARLGFELIPELSQGEFHFDVEFQDGTPLETTAARVARATREVAADPRLRVMFARLGEAERVGGADEQNPARAQLGFAIADPGNRSMERQLIEDIRGVLAQVPGARIAFSRPTYFSFKKPIEVYVFGYDLEELAGVARQVAARLQGIDGLKDVELSLELGSPEVQVRFDRQRLASLGVGLAEAAEALRRQVHGEVVTRFKERDRRLDVRVRERADGGMELEAVPELVVSEVEGVPVVLASVADVGMARGPAEIERLDQQRAALVTANLSGRDLGSVSRDIRRVLKEVPMPAHVSAGLGGQNEELETSFRSLALAVALAVLLVYMVLASQFESLLHPLVIMCTVPLGAVGAVWALGLTRTPVSVVVLVGGIMLAGIVVNNAIVLIDTVNRRRRDGATKLDAVVEGARTRLRPILMTTATTILGLAPMAFGLGEGAEIRAPMATAVIGGLLVSTALTLVVIPVLYAVIDRRP